MKKYIRPDLNVIFMNSADVVSASSVTVNSLAADCRYTSWDSLFGDGFIG